MMVGHGDELPVSMMPVDGTYPSGTTKWEKRNISDLVPVWEPEICIQCGNCAYVCPHSVIRAKFYNEDNLKKAPDGFSICTHQCTRISGNKIYTAGLCSKTAPVVIFVLKYARP